MSNLVVTKQIVRDKLILNGNQSVSELCFTIFKDETISMMRFNEIMAYVMELEQEGTISYNAFKGYYSCDKVI
jgi:hypothetical protein